ncbi:1-hydroxycarotenoid 3,4-desaturase CrtD [Polaribacter glomeratus]|uniref:Phytoene dehydrogenase n=1 Tax=Polaribacter glomeratus TaxID=102 RepID=A0A2S7WX04_9FLAO|nr:1-hydroxycarotenoid 3,4-desaturase CrtD [Polaribacter glomeratus]PQJ82125.1 phytoene dehydrogenase [Polaribacter glomeratus]TXD66719.1 phytoene desaturase [Polaribacter glomeratus]
MKKAIIVGSGIAGIATAIRLQNKGYAVKVLEKNSYPGGKLTQLHGNGFRFDAGPSLFTMPNLVTELFEISGKNPSDYFKYEKLDILCNYFYEDGTRISANADINTFANEIETKTTDSAKQVKKHLEKSAFIYKATEAQFLSKSLHKISSFLSFSTLLSLFKLPFLNIFSSMNQVNQKAFKDSKTIRIFNRYATYNGSNPYKAPGILNIIPHLEFGLGAYLPKGGMHEITNSLVKLAKEIGVQFHFNEEVTAIETKNNLAQSVVTKSGSYAGDIVVCNADIHTVYEKLIPSAKKLAEVDKQERSSSALIFYWGIGKEFAELDVHNILFTEDYKTEFDYLFESKTIYKDPTIYINITSKQIKGDAPKHKENWFVMINVPSVYEQDWENMIAEARKNILIKISRILNQDIESLIEFEEQLTPQLIQDKTNSFKGSLYGTSSNNRFSAFFRHKNFSNEYKNLFFCGGSVHPGGGIPLALSSAKIIDKFIK